MATWDETKPAGSRNPKLGDDDIREFKNAIRERLALDHQFAATESPAFGETGSLIGMHKRVMLTELAADPTMSSNMGAVYTKETAAKTELYWRDEDGNVVQLTKLGRLFLQKLEGEELILDADEDTGITADTDDQIDFEVGGADQLRLVDGMIQPAVNNDLDLGSATYRMKDGHFVDLHVYSGLTLAGVVSATISGTIASSAAINQSGTLALTGAFTRDAIAQGKDVTAAIHRKIIEIGDWDMDANGTKTVAHGLTLDKIRGVHVIIRRDDGVYHYQFPHQITEPECWFYLSAADVNLVRRGTGLFDTADWNATSYNRGWITIDYVD